jgi:hypothetical protein
MLLQSITKKLQPSEADLILDFVTGGTISIFNDFAKTVRPESSKLQGIKFFLLEDTINSFSKLKANWDSYNADKISKIAINAAIETLNYIQSKGYLSNYFNVNVFPMRNGGIQFEFDGENFSAELEINNNGELIFILFDDEGSIVESEQLYELSELSTLLEEAIYV